MKTKSSYQKFMDLSDEEKEKQWREFDKEFIADTARPLTPEQRKLWERAKKKPRGRPRVGKGAQVISVSVEKGLLKRVDAKAKATHLSRSQLIAIAWEAMFGKKKAG